MNGLTKTRALVYSTGFVVGVAGLLALMGVADYDPRSGMVDLHPISVYAVAGLIAPVFSVALAFVAIVKGWGPSK